MRFKQPTFFLNLEISCLLRLKFCVLGACFISSPLFFAKNISATPRYGIWVEAEGINQAFNSQANFEHSLEFLEKGGFTDIYYQVYRRGRSWFPSMMADDQPYREALEIGIDPLKQSIERAHAQGQKVHAWLNVLRILDNQQAPLLKIIGSSAALMDNHGESLLAYDSEGRSPREALHGFKLGTPGIWLDPTSPQVRKYLVETLRDLLSAYPELDGVHLDMIRYPMAVLRDDAIGNKGSLEFSFHPSSLMRFSKLHQGVDIDDLSSKIQSDILLKKKWNHWRRSQVTLLVHEIKQLISELAPHIELSAALIPSQEKSLDYVFQDWPSWLRSGLIDTAILMNYSRDRKFVRANVEQALTIETKGQILIGLGAWLMINNPELIALQVKDALTLNANGVVLFSYSNLVLGSKTSEESIRSPGAVLVNQVRNLLLKAIQ